MERVFLPFGAKSSLMVWSSCSHRRQWEFVPASRPMPATTASRVSGLAANRIQEGQHLMNMQMKYTWNIIIRWRVRPHLWLLSMG